MYNCKKHILITAVIMLCFLQIVVSQNCNLPILSNFNSTTQSEFNAIWIDFNSDVEYYEIEFGEKSFPRTLEANISNITENNFTFSNLLQGTTYEIYIRSVCDESNKSDWNGPYFNSTNIDNNESCDLALGITDNNCPIRNTFSIEVTGFDNKILGTDVNLENIALAIEHSWPPDLNIGLTSPNGKSAVLSSHNGNGIDNYGAPSTTCEVNANFNDKACISIKDWIPPFQGDFNAEQELASAFDGEPANGIWQLSICDRAAGDVGLLTHINLEFSTETCQAPQDFVIFDIEGSAVVFKWKKFENCSSIRLTYSEIGAPAEEVFIDIVDCETEIFTATGLKPGTLYELSVDTECSGGTTSNPLCSLSFTTQCSDSDLQEFFDDETICDTNCDSLCSLNGIWNSNINDEGGWFVQNGNLSNAFTGPTGDKNESGNFIQIDPSLNCSNNSIAVISTDCISLSSISDDCGISFYYHMFGNQVGSLFLEYAINEEDWISVWEMNGDQGNDWHFESISLETDIDKGRLRFRTESLSNNNQGVIALDHIKLYNSSTVDLNVYYLDSDNDGFGNQDSVKLFCSNFEISGYSKNNLDCNDEDENINPSAQEISCNQIDENCNGPADDAQTIDIEIQIVNVKDESCKGASDGEINLVANVGVPPFEYEWSNGGSGEINSNLTTGVYTCTVTGSDGCQSISSPIFVGFENVILYNVNNIVNASCQGENDGNISINIAGGTEPYQVRWPNGDEGLFSDKLSAGMYQATISGSNGCSLITDPIEVQGNQILTTGIAIKNDIDCFGDSTGFIQLGIIGGTTPYDIEWSNGDTSSFVSNLKAGGYAVTITDSIGCFSVLDNIEIEEPTNLVVSLNRKQNVLCHGDENGQIDINVNGGTPPYSYFWSNGIFKQDLFEIGQGDYSVTVTDFKACSTVLDNIKILQPSNFDIVLDSISSVSCSGSEEGFVGVNVMGGTQPYTYNWSILDGINSSDNFINSLLPGQYFVTVVDAFGCKSLPGKFEVNNQNIPINISLTQFDEIECYSDSSASIIAVSESVSLPLDFNWSAGVKEVKNVISDTLISLVAGIYNVTVTDADGCVGISDDLLLSQPSEINYSVIELVNNDCFDGNNGSVSIDANGGTGDLNYSWSIDNSFDSGVSNLQNGSYQVTITDELNCTIVSEEINITSPEALVTEVSVNSSSENFDGVIELDVSGGTHPYSYNWNPSSFGSDSIINNLPTGDYAITITDHNGCAIDTVITVDFVSDIKEIENESILKVYPNPAQNELTLDCIDTNCNFSIKIFNPQGIIIEKLNINQEQVINVSTYENGIYFIEVQGEGFYSLLKIIVLH